MGDRPLQEAAEAAYEARLDRDFGDDWISTIVGNAIADGIEVLWKAQGEPSHDDDLDAFLGSKLTAATRAAIKRSVAEYSGDELREAIRTDVEELESVDDLGPLLGAVEELGGSDSSRFAVMVAGTIDVWAVRRNGYFATFETGDDSYEAGALSPRHAQADDPDLRRARLDVAEQFGGLAHRGVSIAGADELDGELRDITFASGTWHDPYHETLRDDPERVALLVEQHLAEFKASSDLDAGRARERLATVIQSGAFATDTERDVVWTVWKRLRR